MLGAKRAVWLCHTSDLQQRSAPEAGESNVQVISERVLKPINPVCSELGYAIGMQCGGAGTEFAAGVFAKVFDSHFAKVNLREAHGAASNGGLGSVINGIDKYTHPLIASTMRVDRAARFSSCFNLNAELASFSGIERVLASDH